MATTTVTTITPTPQVFSYRNVPDSDMVPIPLGEVIFTDSGVAVTAGGATNDQRIAIVCTLPQNYAYAMVEASVHLDTGGNAEAMTWERIGFGQWRSATSAAPIEKAVEAVAQAVQSDLIVGPGHLTWEFPVMPKGIMRPSSPGGSVQFQAHFSNAGIDDVDAVAQFYFRFLSFGILQSNNWEANTPQLVR